ncbi:hypothetical protein ACHAWF_008497 [Thalassiosira exigua]
MHTYINYPDSSNVEAYDDAKRPSDGTSRKCTTYSNACWGSQLGNSVLMEMWMPLFKFCSMSGGIIFRSGGPITWFSERQERSSHSSCEAEIRATDHAARDAVSVRHLIAGLRALGYPIADNESATTLYNDNSACIQWSHNMTMKRTRHMDNKETAVREWVQDGSLNVVHVRGRINPADIFTKEMKDGAHFRRLRDSFMMRASAFSSLAPTPPLAAAAPATRVLASAPGLLEFITAARCLHERKHFLHLSSAGRQYAQAAFLSYPT